MRGQPGPAEGRPGRKLDPRIHDEAQRTRALRSCMRRGLMDCRVKPGNDSGRSCVFQFVIRRVKPGNDRVERDRSISMSAISGEVQRVMSR